MVMVELTVQGVATRVVRVVFEGFDVNVEGVDTIVRGAVADDAEVLALIARARDVGFTVASWRVTGQVSGA